MLSDQYIAGLFDGEGSVVIGKTGEREHELALTISNNHQDVLVMIATKYPGAVVPNKDRCYLYRCGHKAAQVFLENIQPFVVIKKLQVELALAFRVTFITRVSYLSDETLEEREWFRDELSRINQLRGRPDSNGTAFS